MHRMRTACAPHAHRTCQVVHTTDNTYIVMELLSGGGLARKKAGLRAAAPAWPPGGRRLGQASGAGAWGAGHRVWAAPRSVARSGESHRPPAPETQANSSTASSTRAATPRPRPPSSSPRLSSRSSTCTRATSCAADAAAPPPCTCTPLRALPRLRSRTHPPHTPPRCTEM